ncbi:MAG TPA: AraC family transcriptional regulator [Flavisolibacter sp.]|nr:AraC family transcriptional regulator [Flavisolibacter sp.]
MTYYLKEITRIKNTCYANQGQLDTVIGTRRYIDHNYDNELNLQVLSHIRFTSKFHLLRLFKRYYGQTPKQYLIDKRLEESKTCLANGSSITEACFAVGFESPCSFSTLFKSKFGLTPTAYQKKQLSQSLRRDVF